MMSAGCIATTDPEESFDYSDAIKELMCTASSLTRDSQYLKGICTIT